MKKYNRTGLLNKKVDEVSQQNADLTDNGAITGFKVVTQNEYDALPESKYTDGIVYLIKEDEL